MLRAREKGRPWSRAKDQVIREAAAKQPIALQNSRKMMILIIMVAPASEPTAARKMRTKAAVVAFVSSSNSWMFSALKRTAKSIPKANDPLMTRLSNIDRGTSVLAFLTSSDICMHQRCKKVSQIVLTCTTESVPTNARALPCRPTKNARACVGHFPLLLNVVNMTLAEL
jgi:hypothetical protein